MEAHHKNWSEFKHKHLLSIQKLHSELLACKGVKLSAEHMSKYEVHFLSLLDTFSEIKKQAHKTDGLKLFRIYLDLLYKQVFAPMKDYKEKEALLMNTKFMTKITDTILVSMGDYHDTVREESQLLLVSMTQRFLPPQIALQQDQIELI